MTEKIKILIIEDHKLIVEAWTNILNSVDEFEVCASADNTNDAIKLAHIHRPHIVLMDINLKGSSGFEATENIINQIPKVKVIGLSIHDDLSVVKKIFSLGATGYLTKNSSKKELIESIHRVYKGEKFICEEINERFSKTNKMDEKDSNKKELTTKEIEIIKYITQGLTSKEIGEMLKISNRTVDTHRHNILKKLEIPNSAQLSTWAKEKGYV